MSKSSKSLVIGAAISYFLIAINGLYGIFIIPFILSKIGDSNYGVYKTISSISAALLVLDMGVGGTVVRYISKYRAKNQSEEINKYIYIVLKQTILILFITASVTLAFYFLLDVTFSNSFSISELKLAKNFYIIIGLSLFLSIVENIFNGIIIGFGKYVLGNGVKLFRITLRILLVILLLTFFNNPLLLVLIDFFLLLVLMIIEYIYIKFVLKLKVQKNSNRELFRESLKYSLLLFVTSIIAQLNNNLDNVVVGAILGTISVTIYSLGLQLFNIFGQLSTSISNLMLPTVADIIEKNPEKNKPIVDLVVKVGRVQFFLLFTVAVGFVFYGINFARVWVDSSMANDIYFISIILMIPAVFELSINVLLSILRAKNKLGFRTLVITISAILNLIITIIGTLLWGYYMAAVGTAVSMVLGSIVVMGIYYKKTLGISILTLYIKIMKKQWLCITLSGVVSFIIVTAFAPKSDFFFLIFGLILYILVLLPSMFYFGLNKDEKTLAATLAKKTISVFRKNRT